MGHESEARRRRWHHHHRLRRASVASVLALVLVAVAPTGGAAATQRATSPIPPPLGTTEILRSDLSLPQSLVVAADDTVWVANLANDSLAHVQADGSIDLVTDPGLDSPRDLVLDDAGALRFLTGGDPWSLRPAAIGRRSADGTLTYLPLPDDAISAELAIAADDTAWTTDPRGGHLWRVDPGGAASAVTVAGIPEPRLVDVAPDGTVWVADFRTVVGLLPGGGEVVVDPRTIPGVIDGYVSGMAVGPDGSLWLTMWSDDLVLRRHPDGQIEVHDDDALDAPDAPAVIDGSLWMASNDRIVVLHADGTTTVRDHDSLAAPTSFAAASDGTVRFVNRSAETIGIATADLALVHRIARPVLSGAFDLAAGPDGAATMLSSGRASVVIARPGLPLVEAATPLAAPTTLEVGPDGERWLHGYGTAGLLRWDPTGSTTRHLTDQPWVRPLAVAPDRSVWAATWNQLVRLSPSGAPTWFAITPPQDHHPVAAGPDGSLWFLRDDASARRVSPSGVAATVPTPISELSALAAAPDGSIWLGSEGGEIARVPAGTSTATVVGVDPAHDPIVALAVAADGNAWYVTERWGEPSRVVRMRPSGVATDIDLGLNGDPQALAATADGHLWIDVDGSILLRRRVACVPPPFSDVAPSNPFCDAIEWAAGSGITTGYPDGTFHPGAAIERQAMAAFLWRYAGEPATPPDPQRFADVPPGHPFYDAIQWMGATGLSTGTPQPTGLPTFAPGTTLDRQAMAAFLWRFDETVG